MYFIELNVLVSISEISLFKNVDNYNCINTKLKLIITENRFYRMNVIIIILNQMDNTLLNFIFF